VRVRVRVRVVTEVVVNEYTGSLHVMVNGTGFTFVYTEVDEDMVSTGAVVS